MKQSLLTLAAGLLSVFILMLTAQTSRAGNATWKSSPSSGDWNTAANWTPMTVPNAPTDTATFAASNQTTVSNSAAVEVDGVVFDAGASAFTIMPARAFPFYIEGVGITNNSGMIQNFVATVDAFGGSQMAFTNSAKAGSLNVFTNNGAIVGGQDGGIIYFYDSSSADNATFINNGAAFSDSSGGVTVFYGSLTGGSTAGNAVLIANGSDFSDFDDRSAGQISFEIGSHGGTARVEVFGNGHVNVTNHRLTIGSLEGDGRIRARNFLSVGSNNLSTTFSGVIQDYAGFSTACVLTKIGTGKLVLAHANTYTGGTIVKRGTLVVNNFAGSGTGSGPVQVERGKLAGKGTIAGTVIVGTGFGSGAFLAPGYLHGAGRPGVLTIQSLLTFNGDGVYQMQVNSSSAIADEVATVGVVINIGAKFSFADIGNSTLPIGTVFTIINNTSATPIVGTFSNLHDGSTFSSNGNAYQVSYEGGDGNDLTLTVVP
jgi:autotransporter-associated beta strand protein